MEKLKCAEYTKDCFFRGWSTIDLITYKDKIGLPQKLQKYLVKWYHTYLLHPVLDRTEAIIIQHLYLTGIKDSVYREFTFCDICQRTEWSIIKYGKFPEKLAEETLRKKLCVYLIGPYKIRRKVK